VRENAWYAIGDLVLILLALLFLVGCDLTDPKNSVNAIHLDERPTSDRFTKIYVNKEYDKTIEIYKDNEYELCELIIVDTIHGTAIEYVVHPVRDKEIMDENKRNY